jgi:hypothetical protein
LAFLDIWVVLEAGEVGDETFQEEGVEEVVADEEDEDREELLPAHEAIVVEVLGEGVVEFADAVENGDVDAEDREDYAVVGGLD